MGQHVLVPEFGHSASSPPACGERITSRREFDVRSRHTAAWWHLSFSFFSVFKLSRTTSSVPVQHQTCVHVLQSSSRLLEKPLHENLRRFAPQSGKLRHPLGSLQEISTDPLAPKEELLRGTGHSLGHLHPRLILANQTLAHWRIGSFKILQGSIQLYGVVNAKSFGRRRLKIMACLRGGYYVQVSQEMKYTPIFASLSEKSTHRHQSYLPIRTK